MTKIMNSSKKCSQFNNLCNELTLRTTSNWLIPSDSELLDNFNWNIYTLSNSTNNKELCDIYEEDYINLVNSWIILDLNEEKNWNLKFVWNSSDLVINPLRSNALKECLDYFKNKRFNS